MEKTNENRTAGNRTRVAATVAILLCVGILASGCSVIDSIDRQLALWGVVDRTASAGVDILAVVEIVSGKAKLGFGFVILLYQVGLERIEILLG